MAAIPVTISGVLADKFGRTIQSVILFGDMSYSDRQVGGGPIVPPPGGGGQPPSGAHPEHPIWGGPGIDFPDKPGYPPTVGGGPIIPGEPPPEGGGGGGTPIPPEEMAPPPPPPEQYAQQMVVEVWHPDTQTWTATAYETYPSQGPVQPQPAGQQSPGRRR